MYLREMTDEQLCEVQTKNEQRLKNAPEHWKSISMLNALMWDWQREIDDIKSILNSRREAA